MCKPRSSLCFPTSFRRAGPAAAELAGAGCNFSSEPGFLAGSNFLIRTPGRPACPLVLSPHSPPVKPHPTGLPTDHSHAQGTTRVRVGGATVGSLKWGWVQERCWLVHKPAPGERWARSGLLTPLPAARVRFPHPPRLSRGERIPDPRIHKGAWGARRSMTPPRESPRALRRLQPIPFWLSGAGVSRWALGRQPPPPAPGFSEWRVVSSEGGRTEALRGAAPRSADTCGWT